MKVEQRAFTRGMALAMVLAATVASAPPLVAQAAEGIKVHGHWTIDVRNPDGSVASHSDFENALAPDGGGFGGGAALLVQLLGNKRLPGQWGILFHSNDPGATFGPCVPPTTPPNGMPCGPAEPNLTVTVPLTGNPPRPAGVIELSGFFTISNLTNASSITKVETRLTHCDAVTPTSCIPIPLTAHTLSTPIPIRPGQIIQTKVVLSFS